MTIAPPPAVPARRTRPTGPFRALAGTLAVLALDFALLALGVGGFGRLFHHARALALFATWLVGYPTLAVLRPVRTNDPVAKRADPPLVVLALFFLPVLTPVLSAFAEQVHSWPLPGGEALRWSGVALSALGLWIRISAIRQLGSRFSPLIVVQRGHTLETSGWYARVRHPGYVGAWLCNLGIVLTFGSAVTLPLSLLLGIAMHLRAVREEHALEEHFGEEYRAYRERTGRFLPRP